MCAVSTRATGGGGGRGTAEGGTAGFLARGDSADAGEFALRDAIAPSATVVGAPGVATASGSPGHSERGALSAAASGARLSSDAGASRAPSQAISSAAHSQRSFSGSAPKAVSAAARTSPAACVSKCVIGAACAAYSDGGRC